jgi:hypothetical protein
MNKHEYFSLEGESSTALGWFDVSPEYYWMKKNSKEDDTKPMALGSCLHYLMFEEENFDEYMVVLDTKNMKS